MMKGRMTPESLQAARLKCGKITQAELALESGVSRFKISMFETHNGSLTKEEFLKLRETLKRLTPERRAEYVKKCKSK